MSAMTASRKGVSSKFSNNSTLLALTWRLTLVAPLYMLRKSSSG